MVTEEEVLFTIESVIVGLLPTATVPKLRLVLATATLLEPAPLPPDRPWHPVSNTKAPAITLKMAR
jgi:hypothetical protein